MSSFQASLSGPPSESFQSFFGGFSVTIDPPPPGINNDRSLMRFAIIMQHANMAYHVQRAYKEPTICLLRGGGGGGVVWVISEKNILKSDFEDKKNLARKYLPYNSLLGKNILSPEVRGKKILTQTH